VHFHTEIQNWRNAKLANSVRGRLSFSLGGAEAPPKPMPGYVAGQNVKKVTNSYVSDADRPIADVGPMQAVERLRRTSTVLLHAS